MILRIGKIAAIFVAAGIGHYIGDLLGSRPLDALPYEYWGSATFEHYYQGVFVGVFTTSFVYLASKFLKIPELASLPVTFAFSIYLPVAEITTVGESVFSVPSLYTIWGYQTPYFIGLLVTFGAIHLARLSFQTFRQNR